MMEDQDDNAAFITFPTVDPFETFSPAPLWSRCVPAIAVQNLGISLDYSQTTAPSNNSIQMAHFLKQNTCPSSSFPPIAHFQIHNPDPSSSSIPMIRFQQNNSALPTTYIPNSNFQNQNPGPPNSSISDVRYPEHNLGPSSSFIASGHLQNQDPGLSQCSPFHGNIQNQNPGASSSSTPMAHFQTQAWNSEAGQRSVTTMVRLVSPEDNFRTETVLQKDNVMVDGTEVISRQCTNREEQNVIIKNPLKEPTFRMSSPKPKYTRCQWFLIALSWIIAINGLIMFLSFLGLAFSGYSEFLFSSPGNAFVTANGITSLLAAVYFFVRIRKHLLR